MYATFCSCMIAHFNLFKNLYIPFFQYPKPLIMDGWKMQELILETKLSIHISIATNEKSTTFKSFQGIDFNESMHKFRNLSTERLASSFSKAGNGMHLSQNIQSTSYFDTWEDVNTKSQYPKTLKSNHVQIRLHKTLYPNNYFNFHICLSIRLALIWQSLIKLALKLC